MRSILAAVLVAALALAGCFGGDDANDGPAPDNDDDGGPGAPTPGTGGATPPPTVGSPTPVPTRTALLLDFSINACDGLSLSTTTPIETLQALVPGDFTVAAANLPGTGTAVVDVHVCGDLSAGQATVPEAHFGHAAILVDPPADTPWNVPADGRHEYVLQMSAPPGVMVALWSAAGFPLNVGNASLTIADLPALAQIVNGSFGPQYLDGALQASGGSFDTAVTRYHRLDTGDTLVWTGNETTTLEAGGPGAGRLGTEHPLAPLDATGQGQVPGTITHHAATTWSGMNLWRYVAHEGDEATA